MKLLTWLMIALLFISCESSAEKETQSEIDQAVALLKAEGYDTSDYIKYDDNHIIVEGDILIDVNDLLNPQAREKQYRTSVLLSDNQVRNIRIYITSGVSYNWRQGVLQAMNKWNSVSGTKVNFVQGSSSSYDVRVTMESVQQGFLAFAEFPQSNGRAGNKVTLGSAYANNNISYLAQVVVHEFGHTLGMRHTNWFDRNSDGNQSDNEGQGSMGAIHIPGTSTSYDSNSIMNAFINQSNGNFTNGDLVSIRYMYPDGGNNGTIEVTGPSSMQSGSYGEWSLNNGQSGNWWYKYNGGSWQNIGTYTSVSGTINSSLTLAVGYNGTYYYKTVTVY